MLDQGTCMATMEREQESILRVGLLAPVKDLDPHGAWEFGRALVVSQIFETPYALGSTSDTSPRLFVGPLLDEGTDPAGRPRYSASLDPRARFSDGSPLEAEDILRSIERSRGLAGKAQLTLEGQRILFTLERPNVRFDLALASLDCAAVREVNGTLIGTGPFMLHGSLNSEHIRLVRNPHHRPASRIEEIHIRTYLPEADGTPQRLIEAVKNREVDFTNAMSREHMANLTGVRKHLEPGNSTALLFFNTERLADPALRRAIALSIDRSGIAGMFYKNPLAYTASGLLPSKLGGALDGLRYDPVAAKQTLDEVQGPIPRDLSLRVIWSPRTYLPKPQQVGEAIAGHLAEIGLNVRVDVLSGPEAFGRHIATGQYDLYLGGWIADSPDPADFFESLLASHNIPRHGAGLTNHTNFSRWSHPEADAAIDRLRSDGGHRSQAAILRLVAEYVPVFPLLYGPATTIHSWRLQGFRMEAFGNPHFSTMHLRG